MPAMKCTQRSTSWSSGVPPGKASRGEFNNAEPKSMKPPTILVAARDILAKRDWQLTENFERKRFGVPVIAAPKNQPITYGLVTLPGLADRVSLGIEHHFAQVQSLAWRKYQVEILQGFGKKEALHAVCLFHGDDAVQTGVAGIRLAIAHKAGKKGGGHLQIARVVRIEGQVIRGLDDLRSQRIAGMDDLEIGIVHLFRLDVKRGPHLIGRFLQATRAIEVAGARQNGREEGVQGAVTSRDPLTRVHVHLAVPQSAMAGVSQVPIERCNAALPHAIAILVVKQDRGFQQILVVGVNAAADVAGGIRPCTALYVDRRTHQSYF